MVVEVWEAKMKPGKTAEAVALMIEWAKSSLHHIPVCCNRKPVTCPRFS